MYDGDISCIVCKWKVYIQYIGLTTSKGWDQLEYSPLINYA